MLNDIIDDLKSDEGWRPSMYLDSLGFATIGWGFLIDERRGGELPREIAEQWLAYAVTKRWGQLLKRHPWIDDQPDDVQRALGSMSYQLGVSGLSKFKKMLQALKDGDRELAAREALDSRWAAQTTARAYRVTALIRGDL